MTGELPRYFGSVDYWLRRAAGTPVAGNALFDKRRKEIHRYDIADVNGPLTLTLPIVKPHGIPQATWRDVRISDHGQWWHVHRVSLESAYGRTPFFEFYIDRFLPFISRETVDRFPSVLSLNEAIDKEIEQLLLLPILPAGSSFPAESATPFPTEPDSSFPTESNEYLEIHGFREALKSPEPLVKTDSGGERKEAEGVNVEIEKKEQGEREEEKVKKEREEERREEGKKSDKAVLCPSEARISPRPYWQPRRSRFGFLPGLSVLDLLFCLGPEAALWIRESINSQPPCSR